MVLVAVNEEVDCVDGFFGALGDSGARVHIFAQPACRNAERAFILRAATGGAAVEQSLQSTVVRAVELGAVGLYDSPIGVRPHGDDLAGESVRDAGVHAQLNSDQQVVTCGIKSTCRLNAT